MALYSQEAPTSLMNENKWIDNSQRTIIECVGANYNSSDGKCVESRFQKQQCL